MPALPANAQSKNKNRSTLDRRVERSRMAVSPFDGINRIRFKGSLDCGIRIEVCGILNPHSEIGIRQSADSQPCGSPENFVATVYYIPVQRARGRLAAPLPCSSPQRSEMFIESNSHTEIPRSSGATCMSCFAPGGARGFKNAWRL
jgi:hypothetical protein